MFTMRIWGHPVPVLLGVQRSSTELPQNKGQLEDGVMKMFHAGIWSRIFSYSNLVHAVSGAVGSVVAITVFFPLDTVRTRLQIDDNLKSKHPPQLIKEIVKEEGIHGLYRGWFSAVTSLCLSNFIYFYTYNSLQSLVVGPGERPTPSKDLVLGFIAGVVNVLATTPLWVVSTRIKMQGAKLHTKQYKDYTTKNFNYDGIFDCLCKIVRKEGLMSLWNGTVPSLILASNPAIQFMVYEFLKRHFQRIFQTAVDRGDNACFSSGDKHWNETLRILMLDELSGFLYFIIGAIAKAAATFVTYPLQVLQSRMRVGFAKLESTMSILENFAHLIRTKGIGSLYKGMETKLLQTVLTAALMFLTYEKIAAFIFHLMGVHRTAPTR